MAKQQEQQQEVTIEEAYAIAVARVIKAKQDLADAESSLFTFHNQIVMQKVNDEHKAKMDKIEELESELKSQKKDKVK